jgi:hypothetical protein
MTSDRLPPSAPSPEPPPTGWEAWVNRTAAILAVLAALSSGQWGASNLRAILEQGKVNDGWSYYQAKSIKGHVAQNSADLARALTEDVLPERRGALGHFAEKMAGLSDKYEVDKKKQEADCHKLESERDRWVDRSFWFEIGFICLQVGVVLATIGAAAKKKEIWIVSITAGTLGLAIVANGLGEWVPAPRDLAKKLGPKIEAPVGAAEGGAATSPDAAPIATGSATPQGAR